jgi:hypothetical protein
MHHIGHPVHLVLLEVDQVPNGQIWQIDLLVAFKWVEKVPGAQFLHAVSPSVTE